MSEAHDILNALPEAAILTDVSGLILYANSQAREMLNFTPDPDIPSPLCEILPCCPKPFFKQELEKLGPGKPLRIKCDIPSKAPFLPAAKTEISLSRMPCKGPLRYLVILRDVTEPHKNEQALRAILDNSTVGILMVDSQRTITEVNQTLLVMLGYIREELLGESTSLFYESQEAFAHRREVYDEIRSRNKSVQFESSFVRKDRSRLWVQASGRAIDFTDLNKGVVWAIVDISAKRQAEEQLSALAAVVEQSRDIITVKDLDLRVVATNSAFARASGHESPEDLIGKTDAEIFNVSSESEPVRTYMEDEREAQSLPPGQFILREEPNLNSKGETRYFLTRKYPIFNKEGKLIGTGNISTDITLRKQLENDQRLAREAAEQASRAKSEFIAMISHELRTPLTPIIAIADMLALRTQDEKAQQMLGVLKASANNLLSLIQNILDITRIDTNKLQAAPTPFDLHQLIEQSTSFYQPQARTKDLHLYHTIAPDVPARFLSDADLIKQILYNLLSNAIKFTEKGEISIEVRLHEQEAGKPLVCISVNDTGIGLPDEDTIPHLFEDFSQADASITRKYGGSGLGLSISRRLAWLLGGTLIAASNPAGGASFLLSLPRIEEPPDALPPPVPVKLPEPIPLSSPDEEPLSDKNILIVEDSPFNQIALRELVCSLEASPDCANNGDDAIQFASETNYDLVLMDMRLPGMSGIDVIRRIREVSSPHEPAFIAVTADLTSEIRKACARAKVDGFIAKPFNNRTLSNAIRQALSKKHSNNFSI